MKTHWKPGTESSSQQENNYNHKITAKKEKNM